MTVRTAPGGVVRATIAATCSNVLALLPVFLVGALSVPMRQELGYSEAGLGAAVSVFFAVSAAASVGGGLLAQRAGPATAVAIGSTASVVAMVALGAGATRFAHVLAAMCVAGIANAIAQPGASLMLAEIVPPRRQGLAFGFNQGSVPLSTFLAGAAVPVLAMTVGWRAAFLGTLVWGGVILASWPRGAVPGVTRGRTVRPWRALSRVNKDLLPLVVVALLGSGATNALGAFFVESAVADGVPAGVAGGWLAAGSLSGVGARVLWGWLADRRRGRHLGHVAALMGVGAIGPALLALPYPRLLPVATLLAFAAGWGWNGLFAYAVVRAHPTAPAIAIGVATTGIFVGGATGPLAYGILAQAYGFPVAWAATASALVLAAALLVAFNHRFVRADAPQPAPSA